MEFQDLDQDWAAALKPYGRMRDFAAGDQIFLQGDLSESIGIIVTGHASARIHSDRGDETWVDQFNPDDFFGHISMLTQAPIDFEILSLIHI